MKTKNIFKAITCPGCGGTFKKIPGEDNYRCEVCEAFEAYELDGHVFFVDRFEGLGDEYHDPLYFDDRPPECTNCGSDNYPDCRDSCGLFED